MPFLLLALEGGGGGVDGYMSCCAPSRNSSSSLDETDLLGIIPSLLSINSSSFLASKINLQTQFLFITTIKFILKKKKKKKKEPKKLYKI
jgi:hypothetical protein